MIMKKFNLVFTVLITLAVFTGCNKNDTKKEQAKTNETSLKDQYKEAFIYSYALLFNYKTLYQQAIDKSYPGYIGGFNKYRHYSKSFTPDDKDIVTPNNDTPYSWAWLDLRTEPIVVSVPELPKDRYYVMQWFDLYTHNFAYIGSRTNDNKAGNYMFVGPNWKGEKPEGITEVIKSESYFIGTLTRTELKNEKDIENVKKIQAQYLIQPYSKFSKSGKTPEPAKAVNWIPWNEKEALSPEFIKYTNFILQFTEPHPSEKELLEGFKKLGIEAGKPFDFNKLSKEQQVALKEGVDEGLKELNERTASNKDSKGLFGTREFLKNDYMKRSIGVNIGIYGNSIEEAYYTSPQKDDKGNPLNGKQKYIMRFEKNQIPKVKYFWSLTMYTLPTRLLVENPINRYSIGDRTEGLKFGKDGSLEIYIQHEKPSEDKVSNWLPAPDGPFFIVGRYYGPDSSMIDGTWKEPAVKVIE